MPGETDWPKEQPVSDGEKLFHTLYAVLCREEPLPEAALTAVANLFAVVIYAAGVSDDDAVENLKQILRRRPKASSDD